MMKVNALKSFFICLPSVVCVGALWAGNASADGVLEVGAAYYQHDNLYDTDAFSLETQLRYEQNWQLTDSTTLLFKPRLGFDKGNLYKGKATLHEKNRSRSKFAVEELTLTHYLDNFELSVGKQVFSWGLGDMYNPSDHVNPVDTLDPIDNQKLGQWSASLLYLGVSSNLNFIYIPRRSASRLPEQDNRWFRSLAAVQTEAAAQLGFVPAINLSRQVDHHRSTFGAQIISGQWLPGWDVELSYLHSQDATGIYLPELIPQTSGSQLDLVRVFPRYDEASIGLSTAVGEYTFHGISTYRKTKDNQKDDDYLTFLVGARRTFYIADFEFLDRFELIESVEEVTLAMEFVKEKISRHRDPTSAYVNSGFGRTLTNSLLMNLELKLSEDTLLKFGLIQNFELQDSYISVELSHQLSDDFKISTGLDVLNGSADSLFGQWTNNDRLFLSTRYNF
jgi:hypothetical protein